MSKCLKPEQLNFQPTSTNAMGGFRSARCGDTSAFDEIREGVADGWYPKGATLGSRSRLANPPYNAIATVTVRQGEHFWIVVPDSLIPNDLIPA